MVSNHILLTLKYYVKAKNINKLYKNPSQEHSTAMQNEVFP